MQSIEATYQHYRHALNTQGVAAALPWLEQAAALAEHQQPATEYTAGLLQELIGLHEQQGVETRTLYQLQQRLVAALRPRPTRELAYALHHVAQMAQWLDDPDAGRQHYAEALAVADTLPTAAENRVFLLQQLAYLEDQAQQRPAAITTLQQAISEAAAAHLPVPVLVRTELAQWLADTHPQQAELLLLECLREDEVAFGSDSFDAGRRYDDLARFYQEQQRPAEALLAYEAALDRLARHNEMGEADGFLLRIYGQLTSLYRQPTVNRPAEALAAARHAEALACDTGSPELLAQARLALADVLLDQYQGAAARAHYEAVLAFHRTYPTDDPHTVFEEMLLNRVGMAYEIDGHGREAATHYQQARQQLVERFGPAHPDLPWIDERLAACAR